MSSHHPTEASPCPAPAHRPPQPGPDLVLLAHEFTLPAEPPECWRLLTDVETVGRCLPGLSLGERAGRTYPGTFRGRVGPVAVEYAGSGRFVRRSAGARTAVFHAEGTESHGDGAVAATITWRLVPEGPVTRVVVDTELDLTGPPARFSQAVVQDAADPLVASLVTSLQDRLARTVEVRAAVVDGRDGAPGRGSVARLGGLVAAGALGVMVGRRLGRAPADR